MNSVIRRLRRLEGHFGPADRKPRKYLRYVVQRMEGKPGLENATCSRTLWPDGTVLEMVRLGERGEGQEELTDEELDRWVASFPIEGD